RRLKHQPGYVQFARGQINFRTNGGFMKTKPLAALTLLLILPGLGMDCPVDECDPSLSRPNPLAVEIEFSILEGLSSSTDTTGRVRINGLIRNDGTANYVSSENQQTIQLYEDTTFVADQTFQNLAIGEEATIVYERDWDTTNEFPPTYRVAIIY